MKHPFILDLMFISLLVSPLTALHAGWDLSKAETRVDSDTKNSVVAGTIANFKRYDPGLEAFFERAYGYTG
ncbi:MAG: hypothetical protein K9M96_17000 [Deltaproteobacteria bacterium]|nr:hypothetical protein [Deltaproteobacteria bacterium]